MSKMTFFRQFFSKSQSKLCKISKNSLVNPSQIVMKLCNLDKWHSKRYSSRKFCAFLQKGCYTFPCWSYGHADTCARFGDTSRKKVKKKIFFLIDFLRSPALIYRISTSKKRIFTVKKSSQNHRSAQSFFSWA